MRLRTCGLNLQDVMDDFRAAQTEADPNWTEMTFYCPFCREDHVLLAGEKQGTMIARQAARTPAARRRPSGLPPMKPNAPEGWCRWHRTASPQLTAPCAWETCRAPVHVHQNALGRVKTAYLVERCPTCHRNNAVYPTYGAGIRTTKMAGDTPVLQTTLRI